MAGLIYLIVVIAIFLFVVVDFAVRAWRLPGSRWATPDRWGQVVGFITVIATFVLARMLIDAPVIDTIVWLVATVVTAAGVVGATLTWSRRPWLRERHPRRRISSLVINAVIAAAIVGLFA